MVWNLRRGIVAANGGGTHGMRPLGRRGGVMQGIFGARDCLVLSGCVAIALRYGGMSAICRF